MQPGFHRGLHRYRFLLIIYGILCTVWLILRTGRRPNRIVYPCQRAAASQSLWLWSYLFGNGSSLIGSWLSREASLPRLNNLKTEFYEVKRLFLAIILITSIFMFSFNQSGVVSNQLTKWQSQPNFTTRQWSTTSASEDTSINNFCVSIIGSDNPGLSYPAALDQTLNYNQVKDMVWKTLDGDTSSTSLKEIIQDHEWVVIKPNIVTAPLRTIDGTPVTYYWYEGIPHKGQNTDLRVVKAVIEYLVQHKNLRRISIAEGSAEWAKLGQPGTDPNIAMDGWTVHWQEYDNLSYEQIRDEINSVQPGLVDLVDLSYDNYRYAPVPDPFQSGIGGMQRSGYYMPETVLDCDKWIDIAAMKTHSIPAISLTMKLRIGTLANQAYGPPQEGYMELHSYGAEGVKQAIIDMHSYRPADYAIIEGIWSTEGNGPQWGDDLKQNVIIGGNNAVAVDAIGATIMGFNPWDLDYLHLAAMKKLGTFDLKLIEVIGDSINRLAIDFAKPIMWPDNLPYVGRANRNWLINGVYFDTDLNVDFLGNESSIQPVAGMISGGNIWQDYESPSDKIDFKQIFGADADNCIVYAFVYVNSSENMNTNLWIGVDDGIKVWVNGQVVFSEDQGGGYVFPEHRIPISLNQGSNAILCKILNYSGDFEFRLNTSDNDGDTPLAIEYTTIPLNHAPATPDLLSPVDHEMVTTTRPILSWTVPSDEDGDSLHFVVHISSDSLFLANVQIYNSGQNNSGFSPLPPVPEGTGTISYSIQSPLQEGDFWWRVAAWDGNSYGDFTVPFHFTIDTSAVNTAPQPPILLAPLNSQLINSSYPQLSWQVPTDDDGDSLHFQLQCSEDSSFAIGVQSYYSMINTTNFAPQPPYPCGIGTVHFTFSQRLFETTYWWRVSAYDGSVYGQFSIPFQFTIDATPPIIHSIELSDPNCPPDWYNPNLSPRISIAVYYQELHAGYARLFCNVIPLTLVRHNIPSGFACAIDFEIDIEHIDDSNYLFNISILDSAENTAADTFSIQIDGTPPAGATASSPDTSRSRSFVVNWENSASDSGVGLSGKYDIQLKIDDNPFEIWKTQYEGTRCEFADGEQGHRYAFEVAAWDRVGNREPFFGQAESTTWVDTIAAAIDFDHSLAQVPDHYYLKQSYPNPFNNSTCIEFGLPVTGKVRLVIYNLIGCTIKTILQDETRSPGVYYFNWDGTDQAGNQVVSGLYLFKIEVNNFSAIKKLMFLK